MRKKPNRWRKNEVKFFLSDNEKTIIDMKFKASGKRSLSSFIRGTLIEGKVFHVDLSFMHEYNVKLSNISNNINQIARRINGTGNMYEADMQELKKEIENVWHIQKSILSALPLEELSDTSLIPKKRTENS